jgi:prevent-host-death family protein
MNKVVSIQDAQADFSKLVREVEAGAEVTIARDGKPVLRLVKFEEKTPVRRLGFAKGEISYLSDSAWEALEAKFNALFDFQKDSSKGK